MSSSSLSRSLDLEAARRRDVLEVDAAEGRARAGRRSRRSRRRPVVSRQIGHGVDAAELLEQHRLALHHRHRGRRADVAEAEHGGAVGDDRDGVGHPGVVVGQAGSAAIASQTRATPGRVGHARGRRGRRARPSRRSPSCRRGAGRRPGRPRGRRRGRGLRSLWHRSKATTRATPLSRVVAVRETGVTWSTRSRLSGTGAAATHAAGPRPARRPPGSPRPARSRPPRPGCPVPPTSRRPGASSRA